MDTDAETTAGVFMPLSAETGAPCELAMQELFLLGKVLPVGAQLLVRHTFRSAEKGPVEVVYSFALPRDAALRRFRVTGKGFSIHSELRALKEAQELYEKGIEGGHLSVLTRQYGDGLVNLNLGNLRPGEEVTVYLEILAGVELRDTGLRFRFPFTLAPSYHAKAKAIEVEPGQGEIELPGEEFGDIILPRWVEDSQSLHRVGFDLKVSMPGGIAEVASPSHPLRVRNKDDSSTQVSLATAGDLPNRDLVLDVRARGALSETFAGVGKDGKGRFAVVVSSDKFGKTTQAPRRVVFVLDRSGSMEGVPIQQALRSVDACLGALSSDDEFGIVAFDDKVALFQTAMVRGDAEARQRAKQFLTGISARGGTELLAGLLEAHRLLAGHGGDVFLVTDGQVFGTEQIIQRLKAGGIRIHCLGIGSASQDRFLSLLARESGGVSRFLTPRERVDIAAVELFSSAGRPLASDLRVEPKGLPRAGILPSPPGAVFQDNPLVVFGATQGEGEGSLEISWHAGQDSKTLSIPIHVGEDGPAGMLRLLQGSRIVTDLETQLGGHGEGAAEKRMESRVARALEKASFEYGLACSLTALVAVLQREGDRPGELPKTRVVPVGMPQDVRFLSYFAVARGVVACELARASDIADREPYSVETSLSPLLARRARRLSNEDVLLELATQLEPDGGLPGGTEEERVIGSLAMLLLLLSEGHTPQQGAFALHVQRILSYLESVGMSWADQDQRKMIDEALCAAKQGRPVEGDWLSLACAYRKNGKITSKRLWKELRAAAEP